MSDGRRDELEGGESPDDGATIAPGGGGASRDRDESAERSRQGGSGSDGVRSGGYDTPSPQPGSPSPSDGGPLTPPDASPDEGATLVPGGSGRRDGGSGFGGGFAGSLADRFEILGPLGEGGMGVVLKALDKRLGREVALKRLKDDSAESHRLIDRFEREARTVAGLEHPNIVRLYDVLDEPGGVVILMELLDGGSLQQRIDMEGALPVDEVVRIGVQLCDALEAAHARGIVHRDIKPGNVLLTRRGTPKLADFGLAVERTKEGDGRQTVTGSLLGTPHYAAPEQLLDGKGVDARADLYALGATLYAASTGTSPRMIKLGRVPETLRPMIEKCLEERAEDRYQTASEMAEALRESSGKASTTRLPVELERLIELALSDGVLSDREADTLIRKAESLGLDRDEFELVLDARVHASGATRERSAPVPAPLASVAGACPTCGAANEADVRYCGGCGKGLFEPCPDCGRENRTGSKYCGGCGVEIEVSLENQRNKAKQAAERDRLAEEARRKKEALRAEEARRVEEARRKREALREEEARREEDARREYAARVEESVAILQSLPSKVWESEEAETLCSRLERLGTHLGEASEWRSRIRQVRNALKHLARANSLIGQGRLQEGLAALEQGAADCDRCGERANFLARARRPATELSDRGARSLFSWADLGKVSSWLDACERLGVDPKRLGKWRAHCVDAVMVLSEFQRRVLARRHLEAAAILEGFAMRFPEWSDDSLRAAIEECKARFARVRVRRRRTWAGMAIVGLLVVSAGVAVKVWVDWVESKRVQAVDRELKAGAALEAAGHFEHPLILKTRARVVEEVEEGRRAYEAGDYRSAVSTWESAITSASGMATQVKMAEEAAASRAQAESACASLPMPSFNEVSLSRSRLVLELAAAAQAFEEGRFGEAGDVWKRVNSELELLRPVAQAALDVEDLRDRGKPILELLLGEDEPVLRSVVSAVRERFETGEEQYAAGNFAEAQSTLSAAFAELEAIGRPEFLVEQLSSSVTSGDVDSMHRLAVRLLGGWGVRADHRAAVELAERSWIASPDSTSIWLLGGMYQNGLGQAATRDRETYESQLKRSKDGESSAMVLVGRMLEYGRGVEKDLAACVQWYRKAADAGNPHGQRLLGNLLTQGRGVARDDRAAVEWYRKAAEQGEPLAQLALGRMYHEGRGLAQDEQQALSWTRRAAEQGVAAAQDWLGFLYQLGRGVEQDERVAADWYRLAATQGEPLAQLKLGIMFVEGLGVPQDDSAAVLWFRRASEQGQAAAQACLGEMYHQGRGVQQSDTEAVVWYRRAANQGYALAQTTLGDRYSTGRGVAQDDRAAVSWYRKAAEQGHALAQVNLGRMLEAGTGVALDEREAVAWYRKAAEQGNPTAQASLGRMLETGGGVGVDEREAVSWYRKAAEQGEASAQSSLGRMLEAGQGTAKDEREAAVWYRKAAEQQVVEAQYALGAMYESGRGVPQSDADAWTWYRKAAEGGASNAQDKMGYAYSKGIGVEKDYEQAVMWFRKSAAQGEANGMLNLGVCFDNGWGVDRDLAAALEWFRKAAEGGSVVAHRYIGNQYESGRGVHRDLEEASRWFAKAADLGDEEARRSLERVNALKSSATPGSVEEVEPGAAVIDLGDGVLMRLVQIRAGRFTMGSPERERGRDKDESSHTVTISKSFWIGQTEVTQSQWQAVMGSNPSRFEGELNRPVEQVSWNDAQEFCRRLSQKVGMRFRLPTEAEWEYACRAGALSAYSFGEDSRQLGEYAWFSDNSIGSTHPVGSKPPNAWRLHDMHGNVWEWCSDWYGRYPSGVTVDPEGPAGGSGRVLRGGSWNDDAGRCRSAFRISVDPSARNYGLGFRVVKTP